MNMKTLFALLLLSSAAVAQPTTDMSKVPSKELLLAYWKCFDTDDTVNASGKAWDAGDLAGCTLVSREVQRRHFADDFGKLHEWTKANRKARTLL
jgi:hypothetical protein